MVFFRNYFIYGAKPTYNSRYIVAAFASYYFIVINGNEVDKLLLFINERKGILLEISNKSFRLEREQGCQYIDYFLCSEYSGLVAR